jgi:diguanylate cyclase
MTMSANRPLPVAMLKIDQSFIYGMETDPACRSIVQAIVTLAHALKMGMIAKGVEAPNPLAFLRSINCDYAKTFIFSRSLAFLQVINDLKESPVTPLAARA